MRQGIASFVVTQGTVESVRVLLQHYDFVASAVPSHAARQTQLKGHVEPHWGPDTTQIVDGNAAGFQQLLNPGKTSCARFAYLEHALRLQTQTHERGYERDEQPLVGGIIGDVQEDPIRVHGRTVAGRR